MMMMMMGNFSSSPGGRRSPCMYYVCRFPTEDFANFSIRARRNFREKYVFEQKQIVGTFFDGELRATVSKKA